MHGRLTPEAFAIDDEPVLVEVRRGAGSGTISVLTPHPFAWVNMKVRAAYDRQRALDEQREPKRSSGKHIGDVYTLIAMMTEPEFDRCGELARKYAGTEIAEEIRQEAERLFLGEEAPGLRDIEIAVRPNEEERKRFRDGLRSIFPRT